MLTGRLVFKLENTEGYINGPSFSDEDLRTIPKDAQFLKLEKSKVTDKGIKHLLGMTKVLGIDLDSTQITDDALETLSKIPTLRELWLEDTDITDAGLRKLISLNNLEFISVAYTNISKNGINELKAILPKVEVGE